MGHDSTDISLRQDRVAPVDVAVAGAGACHARREPVARWVWWRRSGRDIRRWDVVVVQRTVDGYCHGQPTTDTQRECADRDADPRRWLDDCASDTQRDRFEQ